MEIRKITRLPLADNLDDAYIPISQNNTTKRATADMFGGIDITSDNWVDITDEFEQDWIAGYETYGLTSSTADLTNKQVRVTVETYYIFSSSPVSGEIMGTVTIQLSVYDTWGGSEVSVGTFKDTYGSYGVYPFLDSSIVVNKSSIMYVYNNYNAPDFGGDLTKCPKIIKIEYLKEN